MGEVTLDRKAYLLDIAATQSFLEAMEKHNNLKDDAESTEWLHLLGKRLETLLLFEDGAEAFQTAKDAWELAGSNYIEQSDRSESRRRGCEDTIKYIGKLIADEVWQLHEKNPLRPVYRHLVICEAERQAREKPVSSLADAYRADALLSRPETWGGVEFPWVKVTWVKIQGEN